MREPDFIDKERGVASFGSVKVIFGGGANLNRPFYLNSPMISSDELRRVSADSEAAIAWYEARKAEGK